MKDETLPKSLILKTKKEFEEVFEKGIKKSSGNLTTYSYLSEKPGLKFGFLVDKKIKKAVQRSEEHTSELQSLSRISYAVFCLKKKVHFFKPNQILILLIKIYQNSLALIFPPSCRFYPSCSVYGILALKKFGFLKGSRLTFKRVCKCHPFHPGGYDPV